jgi:hypothetical protein
MRLLRMLGLLNGRNWGLEGSDLDQLRTLVAVHDFLSLSSRIAV